MADKNLTDRKPHFKHAFCVQNAYKTASYTRHDGAGTRVLAPSKASFEPALSAQGAALLAHLEHLVATHKHGRERYHYELHRLLTLVLIGTGMRDIMRLTKLNFNSCNFADGLPITLKFASKVGDILTTLPFEEGGGEEDQNRIPLPFWHYI